MRLLENKKEEYDFYMDLYYPRIIYHKNELTKSNFFSIIMQTQLLLDKNYKDGYFQFSIIILGFGFSFRLKERSENV